MQVTQSAKSVAQVSNRYFLGMNKAYFSLKCLVKQFQLIVGNSFINFKLPVMKDVENFLSRNQKCNFDGVERGRSH